MTTPPSSDVSVIEYRMIGGTLDFYFLSGPTPNEVIEQYGAVVGLPTWQPLWGFGFQLCRYVYLHAHMMRFLALNVSLVLILILRFAFRWGYRSVKETREQVQIGRAHV